MNKSLYFCSLEECFEAEFGLFPYAKVLHCCYLYVYLLVWWLHFG